MDCPKASNNNSTLLRAIYPWCPLCIHLCATVMYSCCLCTTQHCLLLFCPNAKRNRQPARHCQHCSCIKSHFRNGPSLYTCLFEPGPCGHHSVRLKAANHVLIGRAPCQSILPECCQSFVKASCLWFCQPGVEMRCLKRDTVATDCDAFACLQVQQCLYLLCMLICTPCCRHAAKFHRQAK